MTYGVQSKEQREIHRQWRASRLKRCVDLAQCPDVHCLRQGKCLKLSTVEECLKTHFRHMDEWRDEMTQKIHRFLAECGDDEPGAPESSMSEADGLAIFYKELKAHGACS